MIRMLRVAEELKVFDLLVIGRGGGSLEDLWAFNEELLVRAVAACAIPIISAVGHEIDFTLCDFAADLRAETPSAAAEFITSHFVGCAERVAQAEESLGALLVAGVQRADAQLDHARSRLRLLTPAAQIEQGYLRLDDLANRLASGLRHNVQARREQLGEFRGRLGQRSPTLRVQTESQKLLSLWKRLQAASPRSVLNRGFVILRDEAGQPVTRRTQAVKRQRLDAEFGDGTLPVRVE
jgi:exodeoxyribonuclease VII large subunit